MHVTTGLARSKQWFVPFKKLQDEFGVQLNRRADSKALEFDDLVKEGDAFTITLESFSIRKNYDDGKSGNDLLVRSWVRNGNEPTAERIHFFRKDVPEKSVHENLESEHILAIQDYNSNNRLWLSIGITEVDKGLTNDDSLSDTIRGVAQSFGAVFPTILPFSGIASNLIQLLKKVGEDSKKNIEVFRSQIDLYHKSAAEGTLRYGAYVFFNEDVQGAQYKLRDYKLELAANEHGREILHDYAVVKIVPGVVNSGNSDELLDNQQLATARSKIDSPEHLDSLRRIIKYARERQELERYYNLKAKAGIVDLSSAEIKRMIEIKQKLRLLIND